MKNFNRIFITVILVFILITAVADLMLVKYSKKDTGREYRIEIERLANSGDFDNISSYKYVTNVTEITDPTDTSFYTGNSDYILAVSNGKLYRFDYKKALYDPKGLIIIIDLIMAGSLLFVLAILFYLRIKILMPFNRLTEVPEELAKGNLTVPIKEEKNKYFGRFVWGLDLLREQLEDKKKADLEFEKQKKTLLLSLSHDIKTPLSAIKLSAKAIERGLYKDPGKQAEIANGINKQADEIEEYISHIITASRDDFLNLEVNNSEFYLDEIIGSIRDYYRDRLKIDRTDFMIDEHRDCLLKGDRDRSVEVLQNIMENAIKYGDGKEIHISFDAEEDCRLISISNTGEKIPEDELHHIFDSFYRGSNSTKKTGSGLGLYICRKLMKEMDGDVFAAEGEDRFTVTVVFRKG